MVSLLIADYDDTAFGVGTLICQDMVYSWKVGPGEVMTVENKQTNFLSNFLFTFELKQRNTFSEIQFP